MMKQQYQRIQQYKVPIKPCYPEENPPLHSDPIQQGATRTSDPYVTPVWRALRQSSHSALTALIVYLQPQHLNAHLHVIHPTTPDTPQPRRMGPNLKALATFSNTSNPGCGNLPSTAFFFSKSVSPSTD